MPDNIVYSYTIPTIAGSVSYVPVSYQDASGLPITYSLSNQPRYVTIDSTTGFLRLVESVYDILESPSFYVIASNGFTTISRLIKLRFTSEVRAEYLIVGAGGGGGADMGGGGGGGAVQAGNVVIDVNSTHIVTVGAGGTGAVAGTQNPRGTAGGSSFFLTSKEVDQGGITNSYSVLFDGNGDLITATPNAGLALSGNNNWTIEGWFYRIGSLTNSTSSTMSLGTGNSQLFYQMWVGLGSGEIQFGMGTGSWAWQSGWPVTSQTGLIRLNTWHHVAMVRQGVNTFLMYVDGVLRYVNTGLTFGTATFGGTFSLGSYFQGNDGTWFYGYMSNFRIVNGTSVYFVNFTPPTAPLTAVPGTVLLTAQRSSLVDSSSNNLPITLFGDTTLSFLNPFNISDGSVRSMFLDGTGDYISVDQTTRTDLGGSSFTLEMWLYFTAINNVNVNITGKWNSSTQWILQLRGPGQDGIGNQHWRFFFNASSGFDFTEPGTTSVTTNVWYHIALVRNGSTFTFFRNGTLVGGGISSSFITATSDTLTIGTAQNNTSNVQGHIFNYRLVIGTPIYQANFTPSTTALTSVANTVTILCQTVSATTDTTGNLSASLAISNNPFTTSFNPFSIGSQSTKANSQPFIQNIVRITSFDGSTNVPTVANVNGRLFNIHTVTSGNASLIIDQVGTDNIEIFLWGAGGAGGRPGGWGTGSYGGGGAAVRTELIPTVNSRYYIAIGGGGNYNSGAGAAMGGGSACFNGVDNSYGGGGGGFTALYNDLNYGVQSVMLIAAGGGGGGSSRAGSANRGGGGGMPNGQDGFSPYDGRTSYRGRGGTQLFPGVDADSNGANTAGNQGLFQGGNSRTNSYGGGGGGGWMGGSGGGYAESNTMGGGGGGSCYNANNPRLINTVFSNGNLDIPGDVNNYLRTAAGYQAGYGGTNSNGGQSGLAVIRYPIESRYVTNFFTRVDQNSIQSRIAQGGGAGATTHDRTNSNTLASSGASGGGASGNQGNFGYSIPGQGYDGGRSGGAWYPGSGSGAGNRNIVSNDSNNIFDTNVNQFYNTGGDGVANSILGISYFWGGGGGGGGYSSYGGNGGAGGGGGGAPRSSLTTLTDGYGDRRGINPAFDGNVGSLNSQTNVPGGAGGVNTGGGGGGGSHYNVTNNGGNGGSGMVIIKYEGRPWFFGGNITTLGNSTIHTFTTSGLLQGQLITVTPTENVIIEGDSVTYVIGGLNYPDGTRLYWTLRSNSTVSANDLVTANGSFVISTLNNQVGGSFVINTVEDLNFEGNEFINVDIKTGSVTGLTVATATTVVMRESLPAPVANIVITTPKRVFYEGEPIVFTVSSNAAIANGTPIYWTTSGTVTDSDLTQVLGLTSYQGNTATITTVPSFDIDTGLENFVLNLRTRSYSSLIYKTSALTYIYSNAPAAATANVSSIYEGESVRFTLTTTDVPNGTNIYWEQVGTANAAAFSDSINNGNLTVVDNSVSVVRTSNFNTIDDVTRSIILNFRLIGPGEVILATANTTLLDFSNVSVTSNVNSIIEGNTVLYTITTGPNVPNGTVVYWDISGNVSAQDFQGNINSGLAYITNQATTIPVTVKNDSYEGVVETMILNVRSSGPSGVIKASASPVLVYDAAPSFIITSNIAANSTTEGSTVRFTISSTNTPNLSTYYWTLSGTLTAADFTNGLTSGSVVINNDSGFVDIPIADDAAPEETEFFTFNLRSGSVTGPILGSSPTIIVNDLIVADLLLVGGGGPGGSAASGNHNAGGGGAGAYVSLPVRLAKLTSYSITIGAGGARPVWGGQGDNIYNGGQSRFTSLSNIATYTSGSVSTGNIIALGGGYGQGGLFNAGNYGGNGGSGGGGSGGIFGNPGYTIQNSTYGYGSGNNGGSSDQGGQPGGGGGAGAGGGFGGTSSNRVGGAGLANPFPAAHSTVGQLSGGIYYLAGGGGGTGSVGGVGGGGSATFSTNGCTPGSPNTGGGGGGGGAAGNPQQGQAGGSGVAVLRYPGSTILGTGGNTSIIGGYVYHTFTTSAVLNFATFSGSITANTLTVDEGNTVSFSVTTSGIGNGAILYWVNTGTTNGVTDFTSGSNQGSFTITNNAGSFQITMSDDRVSDGTETLAVEIRYFSPTGILISTSPTITVFDTSLVPVYSITPNVATILESGSISYSVTTGNVLPGTTLYWTNSGTTSATDFSTGLNSGSFVIGGSYSAGSGTFVVTTVFDAVTEGSETVIVQLRENSITGTVVATSSTVTVLDATYSITPNAVSIAEGQSVTYSISTTNVAPGTVLYWTNSGTTTGADFTTGSNSGSVTITGTQASGSASLVINALSDASTEPGETIVLELRAYSTSGTILATANTVTVYDTVVTSVTIDILVVAGGGGGGGSTSGVTFGAGGGAGGLIATSRTITPGTILTPTVGGGGSGGDGTNSSSNRGGNGGDSTLSGTNNFVTLTAIGGGGGGGDNITGSRAGAAGGSGGGAARASGGGGGLQPSSASGGFGTGGGQGSAGSGSGGGGGAGNGGQGFGSFGGDGGAGYQWLDGNYYAGGGGGGGTVGSANRGLGGSGIGGNGAQSYAGGEATSPAANTGSGGGGGYNTNSKDPTGGAGGIVIIRYSGSQLARGGSITSSGGYTYHTFTTGTNGQNFIL